MFISYGESVESGFLKWSRSQGQRNGNNDDQPGRRAPASLAHPPSSEPDAFKRFRADGERMTGLSESVITFTVAGIFGAGRLARRLKELESVDLIGPWHVGHWIDYTHTAIRIRFRSRGDARTALIKVGFSAVPPDAST